MDREAGCATFNQDLQLTATLFQDTKSKKYQEKKVIFNFKNFENNYQIRVLSLSLSSPQRATKLQENAILISPHIPTKTLRVFYQKIEFLLTPSIEEKREVVALTKCPDPNAKITFSIRVTLLSEVDNMR